MMNRQENFEHCKHIAKTLKNYIDGKVYCCPHCGDIINVDDFEETEHENENGDNVYICPCCGEEIEEGEAEQLTLYDYFSDVYDIEYRIGSDKKYRSVRVMVACGGPNIYIDTGARCVSLYWWNDKAEYSLLADECEAIDNIFEDLFYC